MFDLSRYPPESGMRLRDAPARTKVEDGYFVAGPAFDIAKVRFQIGDQVFEKSVELNARSVRFKASVPAGDTTMQTWFLDPQGEEIAGAYYVVAERL
jgi:hypothetical protein